MPVLPSQERKAIRARQGENPLRAQTGFRWTQPSQIILQQLPRYQSFKLSEVIWICTGKLRQLFCRLQKVPRHPIPRMAKWFARQTPWELEWTLHSIQLYRLPRSPFGALQRNGSKKGSRLSSFRNQKGRIRFSLTMIKRSSDNRIHAHAERRSHA